MISGTGDAQRELVQRENEREKEREITPSIAIRRRDLAKHRLRSMLREIAPLIAIRDHDLAKHRSRRSRSTLREIAPSIVRSRRRSRDRAVFFWVCPGFSGFCLFLLLFQTPENIFRKIF